MIVAPLLFGCCLAFASASRLLRPFADVDAWKNDFPDLENPRISERVFRNDREYRYLYYGQILTGLPETASQFSGLRIRAIVTLQLLDGVDVLKIEKATLGRMNERSVDKPLSLQSSTDFEELTGEEAQEWNTALTQPIRFQYDASTGAVTNLESMDSDPFWSVNVKRSILAIFNLKLKKTEDALNHPRFGGRSDQDDETKWNGQDSKYFKVMEEGIGGECEAAYFVQAITPRETSQSLAAMSSRPVYVVGDAFKVVKSWNYDNCKSRPIHLESLNSGVQCAGKMGSRSICKSEGAKKENIIDSAASTKYILTGKWNDFCIESADTEAVHKFTPYSDKAGSLSAYVKTSLKLIYAGEFTQGSMRPAAPGLSLPGLYQLLVRDQDEQENTQNGQTAAERLNINEKQQMYKGGEWPNVSAKKTVIKALLTRIVEDLADSEVQPESASLVRKMASIMAHATLDEIGEIHRDIKGLAHQSVAQDQVENLWLDILAASGTKPAVLYIKRQILSGNLDGHRAAQLLTTLTFSIRRPDQDIVSEVLKLCKEPVVTGQTALKKSCWLSFGTLAHSSCVDDDETNIQMQNTIVKNGNPKCTRETRQRMVIELLARMKAFQDEEDQILILKTIGNTGFDESIHDLKQIFKNDKQSTILRMNAIYALIRVAHKYPDLVLAVVLPEYHDKTNPFQLRIAAFDVIVECRASLSILEVIARSLHEEKSMQVGSYVWSKMNSLANATHPCFDKIAKDCGLALEFGKPFLTGMAYSKGIHIDGYSEELKVGGFAQINTIADPSSMLPRGANIRLNGHFLGLSHDIVEAGIDTTGITRFIQKMALSRNQDKGIFADLFSESDDDEILSSERRVNGRSSVELGSRRSFDRPQSDEFDRVSGIGERADEKIAATSYLKIFGYEVHFMTLTPKSLLKAIGESYWKPSDLTRGPLPVDYRKVLIVADSELTIPTELGLPLSMDLKAPVVVSVKGTVGLKTQPSLSSATIGRIPQSFSLASDLKVSAATDLHATMSVRSAYLKIGAGVRARIATVIPLYGDVSVDLKTGKFETNFDIPQEPLELINLDVTPMTFIKRTPKSLVPHQPDRKDFRDQDRSEKIVQFNRQPLENELPARFFAYKTDLMEQPYMLSKNGRQSSQYYEGLPVPVIEIKEISTFDLLKTRLISATVGHPALGLAVDVEGQIQVAHGVPHALLLPIAGKDKLTVTLRPLRTGVRSITATVHFRKEYGSAKSQPTWRTLFDESATYNSPSALERLTSDLPTAFSKGNKSGYSTQVVIKATDSDSEPAVHGVFSWIRGVNGKFIKVAAELSSPHPAWPFQVCLNGHAEYPAEYESWSLKPATKQTITGRWEMAAGRTCNNPDATKVKISFVADKSDAQLFLEKNDLYARSGSVIPEVSSKTVEPVAKMLKPVWQECGSDRKQGARWSPACENLKDIYSRLMQIKVDIDYQNIPRRTKVVLDQAEQLVHALCLWKSEVDNVDVRNTPNHVTVLANFHADKDLMDIVYGTPTKNAKLIGLSVPFPFGPVSADHQPLNLWEAVLKEDLDDVCCVSGNRVNTLDKAKIPVVSSSCWSMLAKDCSAQKQWSVMYAKAGSRDSEGKKVLVWIGDVKIEMKSVSTVQSGPLLRTSADVTVLINGRPIQVTDEKVSLDGQQDIEISFEKDDDESTPYVAVDANKYGLTLWFDGHNVAVKPTFWLRNQICGLCGNNNGEDWDDMLLPSGELAEETQDLFKAYTVQQDQCSTDDFSQDLQESWRYPLATDRQNSECGQLKTVVKTRPGKICFSVDPVESCPAGCRRGGVDADDSSENYQLVRRVGFHCLPENSSLAQRLLAEVNRRILTEISMKPVNDYFVLPSASCSGRTSNTIRM